MAEPGLTLERGRLLAVRKEMAGTMLVTATVATDQTLFVDGVTDFSETGGQLQLPAGTIKAYDRIDLILNTIHLTSQVGVVLAVEDDILVYPTSPEYEADVALDDETGQIVQATVPVYLVPYMGTGIYDPQFGPGVLLESEMTGDWRVLDLMNVEPVGDATYFDPSTIPPSPVTDGTPPVASPATTVRGGVGFLVAQWPAQLNADPVTYEVHISTTTGFTPSAGTKYSEINGTMQFIYTLADGVTPLVIGTTYYVRVIAKDADGSAAAGTQGSGSLILLDADNITSDGTPPAASPTPTLEGSLGILSARWLPQANKDLVTYEAHLSTTTGFTPGAGTKCGETTGTTYVFRKTAAGAALVYGTTYYCKIIAKDADGAAAASAQGSATLAQVAAADVVANSLTANEIAAGAITTSELAAGSVTAAHIVANAINATHIAAGAVTASEIAANAVTAASILAGAVTADKLAAVLIIAGIIKTADSGQRVEMDSQGIRLVAQDGTTMVDLPTDPAKAAQFRGDVIAATLAAGNFSFSGTASQFEPGSIQTLAIGLTNPTTKPIVESAWDSVVLGDPNTYNALFGFVATTTGGVGGATATFVTLYRDDDNSAWGIKEVTQAAPGTNLRSAVLVPNYMIPMGFTKHGTNYYVLWLDSTNMTSFVLQVFQQSDFTLVNEAVVTGDVSTRKTFFLGSDGTNVIIADVHPTTGVLRFRKFDPTTLAFVSNQNSDWTMVNNTGYEGGSFVVRDDGSGVRYWVPPASTDAGNLIVRPFTTLGVEQTTERFASVGGARVGLAYDGTNFWGLTIDGIAYKYTNWKWTTESAKYWVGYTWVDDVGTLHETAVSPRQTFTHKKRSKMRISTPAIPVGAAGVDDPNKVRIYLNRGATEPQASSRFDGKPHVTDALTVRDLSDFVAAGTQNPATNNFPNSTPAELRSSGGEPLLRGNGIPRCRMALSAARPNIANNADVYVKFGTETVDTDNFRPVGMVDGNTQTPDSTYDITLPFAGQYQVIIKAGWVGNATGRRDVFVDVGPGAVERWNYASPGSGGASLGYTMALDIATALTVVRFGVFQNSGGTLDLSNMKVYIEYKGPS